MINQNDVIITRLVAVHDPDAYRRALEILGIGLRRGLLRLHAEGADGKVPVKPGDQAAPV